MKKFFSPQNEELKILGQTLSVSEIKKIIKKFIRANSTEINSLKLRDAEEEILKYCLILWLNSKQNFAISRQDLKIKENISIQFNRLVDKIASQNSYQQLEVNQACQFAAAFQVVIGEAKEKPSYKMKIAAHTLITFPHILGLTLTDLEAFLHVKNSYKRDWMIEHPSTIIGVSLTLSIIAAWFNWVLLKDEIPYLFGKLFGNYEKLDLKKKDIVLDFFMVFPAMFPAFLQAIIIFHAGATVVSAWNYALRRKDIKEYALEESLKSPVSYVADVAALCGFFSKLLIQKEEIKNITEKLYKGKLWQEFRQNLKEGGLKLNLFLMIVGSVKTVQFSLFAQKNLNKYLPKNMALFIAVALFFTTFILNIKQMNKHASNIRSLLCAASQPFSSDYQPHLDEDEKILNIIKFEHQKNKSSICEMLTKLLVYSTHTFASVCFIAAALTEMETGNLVMGVTIASIAIASIVDCISSLSKPLEKRQLNLAIENVKLLSDQEIAKEKFSSCNPLEIWRKNFNPSTQIINAGAKSLSRGRNNLTL